MSSELTVFSADLIPVYNTDTGQQVVIGTELHESLDIKTAYKDWFPRMTEYGFEEGKDFSSYLGTSVETKTGRPKKDHILSLDMAKHIAMIQRSEKGKQIRQKLIELEKKVSRPDSYLIADPIQRAKAWIREQEERKALEAQNAQMLPKAIFADAVAASKSSILVGDLAKILKQNGVEMGQKRLFEWLRQRGYLIRRNGADWNSPTQRSMEMGLFEIKETTITHSDGHTTINKTTKVTGKGQRYFINLFLKEKNK